MANTKVQILGQKEIDARIRRMAYEIYETHYQESQVFLIGIDQRGGYLARQLTGILKDISPLEIILVPAKLDRAQGPHAIGIELEGIEAEEFRGKPVVVVDDVLYTGTTLLNVVAILLQFAPGKIRTAVLIDRGHRNMPVSADFVGLELATTIQQHVSVEMKEDESSAEAFLL
ncbi:MAG: phosphoribosyltransferase family protein [Bacteroidota bacterium]